MIFSDEVAQELAKVTQSKQEEIKKLLQVPKESAHGDIAFPCFLLAKEQKQSPLAIAQSLANQLNLSFGKVTAIGPYINITINNDAFITPILQQIHNGEKIIFAKTDETSPASKRCILIESPSPNTNKPLHLGHLRNMLLGSTIKTLKQSLGHEAHIVNLINDRGVHICKSMLAYKKWGNHQTPESTGMKGDHFVGEWYVRFSKEAKLNPSLEQEAQDMLVAWEQGDPEVVALWKQMNTWTYEGFKETYETIKFTIDKNYYESELYTFGKEIILQGVEDNIFYKDETGAVVVDLTDRKLDKKVLLRKDGTSVYITQDIFLAKQRFDDYHYDELIYVVGNEQEYHFKVLFEIFRKLNYPFAEQCQHFSYGMIELPEGKMKSREGTVVDIDELVKETIALAKDAVEERFPDISEEDKDTRANLIAHGAIRFFFLKFDPVKNFVFDPKASLSFEGETGPYVQYTYARFASILRKSEIEPEKTTYQLLTQKEEKDIAKQLQQYNEVVTQSAEKLKPNLLCNYLLNLCQLCNSYYSKHKIIQDDKSLQAQRLGLLVAVNTIIKEGLQLLDIVAPEKM